MHTRKIIAISLCACLALPSVSAAQSATSCVDHAWGAFRDEIESKAQPLTQRGNDYLAAFGWIRAAQTCLEFATYPDTAAAEKAAFRAAIAATAEAIEMAVRTNTSPPIFGMSQGGSGGLEYFYPDEPPSVGRSSGGQAADTNVVYRMLSLREWALVQRRLTRLGHDTGGIDGVAGPRTYAAIESYQRSLGQRPTGVLSSRQIDALLN